MYVKSHGSGSRVFVGLHGWTGGYWTYDPLVPHLPDDAVFHSVDLPGYGQTPQPEPFHLETVLDEIVALVRSLDTPRFTLVGNCSGGALALFAVERWLREGGDEARFERLVILDLFGYSPWYFRALLARPFGPPAYRLLFDSAFGRWLMNRSVRRHEDSKMDFEEIFSRVDHRVTYRYMEMLVKQGRELPRLDVGIPMDFVHGEKTFGAVKKSLAIVRGMYPGARITALEGAGHLPIREATEQLAGVIFGPRGG